MKHLTADQKGSGALSFPHSAALGWLNVLNGKSATGGEYMFPTHQREFSVDELLFLWPLGDFSGLKPWRPLYVKC